MKYFKVTAKCGHVGGTHKYIPIEFYTAAENASSAAKMVRNAPRVKHHQKDAIMNVIEIEYDEFLIGQENFSKDPYIRCNSKQEQELYLSEISSRIYDEAERYEPWLNKYKYRDMDAEKRPNYKRALKYGYKKHDLLETQGSFDYRKYCDEFAA